MAARPGRPECLIIKRMPQPDIAATRSGIRVRRRRLARQLRPPLHIGGYERAIPMDRPRAVTHIAISDRIDWQVVSSSRVPARAAN